MKSLSPASLVRLYAVLMVASVAVALAGLTWRLMGYAGGAEAPVVSVAAPSAGGGARAGATDVSAMIRLAPFGRSEPGAAAATRLPLTLRGVVQARPAEASTAWIESEDGKVVSYAVGGAIPGGATLNSVAADHVILDVGGNLERLDFPKPENPKTEQTLPAQSGRGTAGPIATEDDQTNE